jgi:hypothetical protein
MKSGAIRSDDGAKILFSVFKEKNVHMPVQRKAPARPRPNAAQKLTLMDNISNAPVIPLTIEFFSFF